MTSLIHAPCEFSRATTGLVYQTTVNLGKLARSPTSRPANIVWLDGFRAEDIPVPDGFVDIDAAVEERERSDPAFPPRLQAARMRLANRLEPRSLAHLRLRCGLSQKQLADAIGTSQPHIARIESGRDNVLLKTANALAGALRVTLADINVALGYGDTGS